MSSAGPRDRYYSAAPGIHNVGMSYAWGPALEQTGGANIVTGNWAPIQLDSSGNLLVSLAGASAAGGLPIQGGNTIPVWVTGGLTFTGTVTSSATGVFTPNNTDVVNAVSTGNARLLVADQLLSGISGQNATLLAGAPIYVTGNIGGSNPIGVTGTKLDTAATYSGSSLAPYNLITIGGRVTNPTGAGSVTGDYNTGSFAMLNFAPNGAPYINQGVLDRTQDEVTSWTAGATGVSNDVLSGTFGIALSSNANRKQWFIQNLATGGLLVRYSLSLPTATSYNMVLKGGTNAADGLGAVYSDDVYRGPVSVTGQGGAPISYTIWEVA